MAAPARPRAGATGAQPSAGARALEFVTSRDRVLLRAFLERDRLLSGYALCALDERPFQQARWGVALRDGDPVAVATEQGGPAPQPVFVAGDPEAAGLLLRRVIRPWIAYIAARPELLPPIEALYRLDKGPSMVRMAVDREHFRPYAGPVQRLTASSVGELNRMYDLGFTSWLPAEALAIGVY
jgi:hypothetical protein